MTFTHSVASNNFGCAKWIVSPSVAEGTHTTIQAAINSASSGDTVFIRPATYTEAITLKAGVNLTAFGSDASLNGTGKVIISGTCTFTDAGSVTISGIQLQTNSAALLAVTGTLASVVNLENCYLNMTNNTGITFSTSSASAKINISYCSGDLGTTGIALMAHSSAGRMNIFHSDFTNSGGSSTASTISAGSFVAKHCDFSFPFTTSSTGGFDGNWTRIDSSAQNVTPLTIGGSGGTFFFGALTSGTASAASIGVAFNISQSSISSTNTNALTGAGTINQYGNVYTNTSHQVNVTTATGGAANGLTQGTAPSAGMLGERIVATGSAVNLPNSTPTNICSISLTAGIWDVTGLCMIQILGTGQGSQLGLSSASATFQGANGDQISLETLGTSAANRMHSVPAFRVTLSSSATYYLVGQATFTTSTANGTGRISAVRVG